MTRHSLIDPAVRLAAQPPAATDHAPTRRQFLSGMLQAAGTLLALPLMAHRLGAQGPATPGQPGRTAGTHAVLPALTVYKDVSCGCCKEWVKHMQKAGFTVTTHDMPDMDAVKTKLGVPSALQSCHTGVVGDYLLEGHVPADVVQRLLREKPAARGLAVPGMPQGSPGMEGPVKDRYDVVLFEHSGKSRVYASR